MSGTTDWARRQRAARETWVEAGGKRFLYRRPLDLEMRHLLQRGADIGEALALEFVVGWEGVTEADLVPGVGGDAAVPFTPEVYREYIGDRMVVLGELADAIWSAYKAHREALGDIPGKSAST